MVLEVQASEVMQTPGSLRRTGVDSVSEDSFVLASEVHTGGALCVKG